VLNIRRTLCRVSHWSFLLLVHTACSPAPPAPIPAPAGQTAGEPALPERPEILWDTYGIPHIFARSAHDASRAFGWAQAHSHGDLLLSLYGEARGRAAEYWGAHNLQQDRNLRTLGVPGRARVWYEQQDPGMKRVLDAFAEGINAYASAHPERIADSVKVVLPVHGTDVLAHINRVLHFTFITGRAGIEGQLNAIREPGSNAWAVAPANSATGHALLLINPHLPWDGLYTLYEAQLVAPGLDAYGAALVGTPMFIVGFNDHLGWTHTVNPLDAADLYELTRSGSGYLWDGGVRDFEVRADTIRVRRADGELVPEVLQIRSSVHGPVVAQQEDRAYALRVAGIDEPHVLDQYDEMIRATNRMEFEAALSRLQMPFFNVVYADRDGHILYVFNGRVPDRPQGDWAFWARPVRGDTSATLWTGSHEYGELPRVLDPPNGWLQNANEPPWTATVPVLLHPDSFPAYMAPRGMGLRPQRSVRMLMENPRLTLDEMIRLKHSTRLELADRVLDDLITAARANGGADARRAADVLERWDRSADAGSRGTVLFLAWAQAAVSRSGGSGNLFASGWTMSDPMNGPAGLRDPRVAAAVLDSVAPVVESRHGALDVAWGELHRLRRDSVDLPANGGPGDFGIFRVTSFAPHADGRSAAVHGDSYVAAIEFSTPVRARALLGYGNASQPGSPHRTDQLHLYSRKELRPVWRTRAEIEANLATRETLR
jgi:acyl-homoserine-lactone acylase